MGKATGLAIRVSVSSSLLMATMIQKSSVPENPRSVSQTLTGDTGWGGRPVPQEQAHGMLVAALGLLAAHYGLAGGRAA